MGRRDARDDPRVRRPALERVASNAFREKRTRLMKVMMVLAMVVVAAGEAAAQTPKRLEPVVVTATKVETPQARLGASVTVVTGDEIIEKNYPTVEEALRHVPGVDIQRSGGLGKTTAIRIRGAGAQQVQVMVDGLRVKSPTL